MASDPHFRKQLVTVLPGGGFVELYFMPEEPAGKRLVRWPLIGWAVYRDVAKNCPGCWECHSDDYAELVPLSADNTGYVEPSSDLPQRIAIVHESEPPMQEEDAAAIYGRQKIEEDARSAAARAKRLKEEADLKAKKVAP